ncbi:hypothetical protein Maq22A_c15785 [Methylobacterium aquaticum]|uniref:Uncharacterized protein n=1 Tax=Methylobacterium aquaticum TaxID=270351 RepID=A0A0C6FM95_9HYPH|nr:hypothetical protein Maq22A_c15785 [Methylobacterium aquaticum]
MTLLIEGCVELILLGSRGIVRDHGRRALASNGLAQLITVVGRISQDNRSREIRQQRLGLGRIALLARRDDKPNRTAQTAHGQVDLGAQAATGSAKSLIGRGRIIRPPFFAPAACW